MADSPSTAARKIKAPTDHKSPAQAEAEGVATIDVVWRDLTFTVPAEVLDWPTVAIAAFQEGKEVVAVREGLGAVQFQALIKKDPAYRAFTEIYVALSKAMGFSTGE